MSNLSSHNFATNFLLEQIQFDQPKQTRESRHQSKNEKQAEGTLEVTQDQTFS